MEPERTDLPPPHCFNVAAAGRAFHREKMARCWPRRGLEWGRFVLRQPGA